MVDFCINYQLQRASRSPFLSGKKENVMKKIILAFASICISMSLHATQPAPSRTGDTNAQAGSASQAAAVAGASAAAGASSNAGVHADLKLQSSSSLSNIGVNSATNSASTGSMADNSQRDDSSTVFVAPAPSTAVLPQAYGCIVSRNVAGGLAWNFVSGAKADQQSDAVCAGLKLADTLERNCQYLNAALIRERVAHTLFPSFSAMQTAPGLSNLSPADCRSLASAK